jgi:hypothetical protein
MCIEIMYYLLFITQLMIKRIQSIINYRWVKYASQSLILNEKVNGKHYK